MEKIIVVGGPTASGKSNFAVKIAKNIHSEIISADSMQIYRKMNVGTAKVTQDEMQGIRHHMIDVVDPSEPFSVSMYVDMVRPIISQLNAENKIPVIVGGTGLYIDALIYDFEFNNADIDLEYRHSLEKYALDNGNIALHNMLVSIDPVEAEKIHPNNVKRVIRALEICKNGVTKSENKKNLHYDIDMYILNPARDILYDRINRRVDIMMQNHLETEIQSLLSNGIDFDMQSMQAIGYKEWKDYFDNKTSIENISELIKKNSRNYAKRQITWFMNKYKDFAHIVDIDDINNAIDEVNTFINK